MMISAEMEKLSIRERMLREFDTGIRLRARESAAMIERLMKDYGHLCVAAANQRTPRPEPDEGLIGDALKMAILGRLP